MYERLILTPFQNRRPIYIGINITHSVKKNETLSIQIIGMGKKSARFDTQFSYLCPGDVYRNIYLRRLIELTMSISGI